jgi:hypothetical protein
MLANDANERALAGRVAGVLWLSAAPMLAFAALPGYRGASTMVVLALATVCVMWALSCLFVIPWRRLERTLVFHLGAVVSLGLVAAAVAVTGAADSPLWVVLVSVIAYCAYFFSARAAAAYVAGCLLVQALPLAYDPGAVEAGLLGETWVAAPTFAGVGTGDRARQGAPAGPA